MHLYRLVFSKSRCLWPSLSDLFFGPFGLLVLLEGLYSPLKSKKSLGRGRSPPCPPPLRRCATGAPLRGARAGLRPTRSPTAISKPNPNPTAISTKNADFVYLCRCAPPDLRVVVSHIETALVSADPSGFLPLSSL